MVNNSKDDSSSKLIKTGGGSTTSSLFVVDDENKSENEFNHNIEATPIICRSPSKILNLLNIDKRTQIDPVLSSTIKIEQISYERTLAIIKPNAMIYQTEIEKRIYDEGFEIIMQRKLHLSPEYASEFYSSFYGTLVFPTIIVYMSSRPIMVYCLARKKAISHWNTVIGPENVTEAEFFWPSSLRAIYGKYDTIDNAVHGSKDEVAAKWEIRFFFPNTILEPIAIEEIAEDYLNDCTNAVVSKGLAELLRVKPIDPILWFAEWLLWNNPNRPKLPEPIIRTKT